MNENQIIGLVLVCGIIFIILIVVLYILFMKEEEELIVEKRHENVKLDSLQDSSDLISVYLKKNDFDEFYNSNRRLKELNLKIKNWIEKNPPIGMGKMFPLEVRLNNVVIEYFKEYADICYAHYNKVKEDL